MTKSSNTEYYFAYGSNMDEHRLKEKRKITFYEKFSGKLDGWELIFNKIASTKPGVAYSNIQTKENSSVEGIIYKINSKDIEKLDKYEGYPKHYERKSILIETQNGPLKCLVYIANPNKIQAGLNPDREYLNHILAGKEFLSDQYYSNLKNTPCFFVVEVPTIEATIGNEVYHFSKDPGLKEIEFKKSMEKNNKSFKSKISDDEIVAISVWTTPKRTKTYPFPRVYSTLGHNGKKITIIPVQASYGKYGDDNKLQPGTLSWMTGLGVYVIIGVFTKATMRAKGKAAANAKEGKISTQGKPVFTNFEFDNNELEDQVKEIVSKCPKVEDWNQEQLLKIPALLELAIENNRQLGKALGVPVRSFKSLEKDLEKWKTDIDTFLSDCDEESKGAQHREFSSEQKLENVPGKKGKINVDWGNSKMIFLTVDSVSVDKDKKIIEILEGKHSTKRKFPGEHDVLDALFKLMIFKKSEIKIDGEKYTKKLVCYLSGTGKVTDKEIKVKYRKLIDECGANTIEFRFNDETIK